MRCAICPCDPPCTVLVGHNCTQHIIPIRLRSKEYKYTIHLRAIRWRPADMIKSVERIVLRAPKIQSLRLINCHKIWINMQIVDYNYRQTFVS